MKAYVAGPFFNEQQIESMEKIERVLEKHSIEMFRPRFDAGQIKEMRNATNEDLKRVFNNDLNGLIDSDMIIANLTFKDTGTSFELGYAHALKLPVILFNDETVSGKKINLMLAAVADHYFNSIEELSAYFDGTDDDCAKKVNGHELEIE